MVNVEWGLARLIENSGEKSYTKLAFNFSSLYVHIIPIHFRSNLVMRRKGLK